MINDCAFLEDIMLVHNKLLLKAYGTPSSATMRIDCALKDRYLLLRSNDSIGYNDIIV